MIIGSTGRIGGVLVALRCVEIEDKALSMAFNVAFLSLFAMLPAPLIYGHLIDTTCDQWQFRNQCKRLCAAQTHVMPHMRTPFEY